MTHRRQLLTALILVFVLATGLIPASAAPPAQTNLLLNPGFEDPYIPFQSDATRMVADGWSAWHVPQREGDEGFRNLKPDYQPASASNPDRILSGSNAQEYSSFFSTHTGGVYQQLSVPTGSEVIFSVAVYIWSTSGDDPDLSADPGRVQVQVGVDPNGGTDGESERVNWSLPLEFYDAYEEVTVRVPDVSNRITVFVRTTFDLPQKHNVVYLDNASLVLVGAAAPTSTATTVPTETLNPTATLVPTQTLIPTLAQTSTPSNTPQPGIPTPTQEVDETEAPFATATPTSIPPSAEFPYRLAYTVVAGDTVSRIAARFGSSINAILAANNLNADGLIFVGQTLSIPVAEQPVPTATPTYSPTSMGIIPTNTPVGAGPAPAPTAVAPATTAYTVERGDTLNQIAIRFGTTVDAIVQRNGILNPNLIIVGQQLTLPVTAQPPAPTPVPQPPQPSLHIVQPGENLFRISLRYNIPVNTLAQLNGIYNVNRIYVGQAIRLR